jgi:predicted DNA-binding ribbon-helix-helix protein
LTNNDKDKKMRIENNKVVRNTRNSFTETKVRSVRAEPAFWEMCDSIAKEENTSTNELIVRVVYEYCNNKKEV